MYDFCLFTSVCTEEKRIPFRTALCLFLFSLFFVVLLFGWTLRYGYFFSDDFTWLWYGKRIIENRESWLTLSMSTFYSPVINLVYAFLYKLVGFSAPFYFLFGLLVHTLVAFASGILLFLLSRSKIAAFLSAFLVAVAGGAYEPLVWVGANMHSIVTLFILGSLIGYACFVRFGKVRYIVVSLLSFILALGTKEMAIVTPALLLFTFFVLREQRGEYQKNLHSLFWGIIILLFAVYGVYEYFAQKQSVWVAEQIWKISPRAFLRLPFIFVDQFLPLHGLIQKGNALWFAFLSVVFAGYVLVRYKFLPLVWYGVLWIGVACAPTLFFTTNNFFEPLASRYNYLPRIGAVFMLSVVFSSIITNSVVKHSIKKVGVILGFIVLFQMYSLTNIIFHDYPSVYHSGRELVELTQNIKARDAKSITVLPERPFPNNVAHMIGIFDSVAHIPEKDVYFLDTKVNLNTYSYRPGEVVVQWNMNTREYETFTKP